METGTRLGPYEVLDRLGAGGVGEVYLARDTRLGRTVAVKVLRERGDQALLSRLDREARAASSLNHRNIVQVYDVGEAADGTRYVVMEHVEGETLRRRLNRGRPALDEVLDWGAQVAEGLSRAHGAGIVHRDLKPENLMLTADQTVKILDFGLAKMGAAPLGDLDTQRTLSKHATREGTILGTLEYMAPEQAAGRVVDSRADTFALGAILYEMATGHVAFHRPSAAEVLAAILERQPEPMRSLRPDIPAALEDLVGQCLAKDPQWRPADVARVGRELRGIREGKASAVPVAIAQVVPPPLPVRAEVPSRWSVQSDSDEKVRGYEEVKLVEAIRKRKLSGLEMVRREGEDEWRPLHDTALYRREVPGNDPVRAARVRSLRDVGGHLTGYVIACTTVIAASHEVQSWMAIWGVFVVGHALKSVPTVLAILRDQRAALPAPPAPALPAAASPSPLATEAARVRALLEKRGGDDLPKLLADVDAVLTSIRELGSRIADLEEQTSGTEKAAVAASEREAQARLGRAASDEDRAVFERQREVAERRRRGLDEAERVLDRLRARRDTAEQELKQLRLDLSRGAATAMPVPELTSRLDFIRHEVAAAEEIARSDR